MMIHPGHAVIAAIWALVTVYFIVKDETISAVLNGSICVLNVYLAVRS